MFRKCFLLLLLALLLVACGPSEADIAAMTAAAATDTPAPTATPEPTATATLTPTATPIPYDLTVSVVDADGAPLAGAIVTLASLGDAENAAQATGDDGVVHWTDLPGEGIDLAVAAQGYFSVEASGLIERGPNDVPVTLERDPYGVLPAAACAPGETLLEVEDFQDGMAQGWGGLREAVEFNAPNGWAIEADPQVEGNLVASMTSFGTAGPDEGEPFTNAVWRIKVMLTGQGAPPSDMFLNWYHGGSSAGEWRYPLQMGPSGVFTAFTRLQMPEPGHMWLQTTGHTLKPDTWYFFEIGTYEGTTVVYIDGQKLVEYFDPQPFEWGRFSIEPHVSEDSAAAGLKYFYDDSVICGLDAMFEPLPPPEEEEPAG